MNTEMKLLIEDAAKMLGIRDYNWLGDGSFWVGPYDGGFDFNPLDPERGDLMKVAEAAELFLNFKTYQVVDFDSDVAWFFDRDDYQSLALAVLRAASAVLKAKKDEQAEVDKALDMDDAAQASPIDLMECLQDRPVEPSKAVQGKCVVQALAF